MQIFLQNGQSFLLISNKPPSLPEFLPQLLALRPHGLIFLRQSLIFLSHEPHSVLDTHQLIIFLLHKFPLDHLLFLLGSLLLLETQLSHTYLIGYAFFYTQDQVLVLSGLVLRFAHRAPGILSCTLALQLKIAFFSQSSGLLHLQELHTRSGTSLPPLNALIQRLLLTSQILHQYLLPLADFIQFSTVIGLHF